jgi:cyclophilin family peptidyl-prolyl cis-trans isomerase
MKNLLIATVLSIFVITGCNNATTGDSKQNEKTKTEKAQPAEPADAAKPEQQPEKKQSAGQATGSKVLISTPFGDMTAVLYDATPQHRDNFLKLAREGFYDGTLFHRVIRGFMIQGGDPDSRGATPDQRLGMGGPGYTIPAEFHPDLIHKKGALAAARLGGPQNPEKRSSGSQFYIVQGKTHTAAELNRIASQTGAFYTGEQIQTYQQLGGTPNLDTEYTVFGEVIDGIEVIDKIAAVKTAPGDRPVEDVKMTITILDQ